jgi:hypothetical protein
VLIRRLVGCASISLIALSLLSLCLLAMDWFPDATVEIEVAWVRTAGIVLRVVILAAALSICVIMIADQLARR